MTPEQQMVPNVLKGFRECINELMKQEKPDRHGVAIAHGEIDGCNFQVQVVVTINRTDFVLRGHIDPINIGALDARHV